MKGRKGTQGMEENTPGNELMDTIFHAVNCSVCCIQPAMMVCHVDDVHLYLRCSVAACSRDWFTWTGICRR